MTMVEGEVCEIVAPEVTEPDADIYKAEIELLYFFRESTHFCYAVSGSVNI